MTKRLCFAVSLLLFLSSCVPAATPTPTAVPTVAPTAVPAPTPTQQRESVALKILFIGNSLTYVNDLPRMFARLAEAGGHQVNADMSAKPGYLLEEHVTDPDTLKKIDSTQWDLVVLQENGGIPRDESKRDEHMYPAARALDQMIRDKGARTIFYMTWASPWHVFTDKSDDFVAEQARVSTAHQMIARELDASVAPVGDAFARSLQKRPDLFLWQDDKVHPNHRGTYLAACVFYALIYRQSPEGLGYRAGLSEDTVQFLQSIAAETVLIDSAP